MAQDQLEALSMSDTVALMKDGVVVQEGAPRDVYQHRLGLLLPGGAETVWRRAWIAERVRALLQSD